ncbi:DUF3311 domain-containing protein [Sulfoacidibacillus thermotolerans]|uniref:DUF3311 domain-containing protein n=1 Tax=Sulfoacidibacillus thermotolerans TaxID=1765684 RepID=A0A2U3D749_SULT2|nr:DUF3311 domain-containing protein [Sulfoacidibacillus thermotolerans]PWI57109.1 hypothetical protein BM613_10140 [Sulfoacidibacillus thermotolerans]
MNESSKRKRNRGWLWLLLVPYIVTLFPQFYSTYQPTLWGFPFFYWYQFLWVILSALLTWFVYVVTK